MDAGGADGRPWVTTFSIDIGLREQSE